MIKASFNKNICRILTFFVIFGLTLPGFSMYIANYSDKAFCDSNSTSEINVNNVNCPESSNIVALTSKTNYSQYSIRELIIRSAGYFLQGQSHINALSEMIELSDIEKVSFYNLQATVNNAFNNIYYAWWWYQELQSSAAYTAYNPEVIEKLTTFDYDEFQKKHNLNEGIYQEVKTFLITGDIRGAYFHISSNICNIYYLLEVAQTAIYKGIIPDNSTMWDLNEACAENHLFGQYMARIFAEIN